MISLIEKTMILIKNRQILCGKWLIGSSVRLESQSLPVQAHSFTKPVSCCRAGLLSSKHYSPRKKIYQGFKTVFIHVYVQPRITPRPNFIKLTSH